MIRGSSANQEVECERRGVFVWREVS